MKQRSGNTSNIYRFVLRARSPIPNIAAGKKNGRRWEGVKRYSLNSKCKKKHTMNVIASNDFFEISTVGEIALLDIKEKVFESITDLNLSGRLLEFISGLDHNPAIKALIFFNSPESLNEESYDRFIQRILSKDKPCDESTPPSFTERNVRFREINVLNKLIRTIGSLQTLVISGIQGTVVTPFIGAALVADFRYAAENAVFSMIHNKYGLHPSGGLPFFLSSFLHHSKAMEVQLSDHISADEALELGLVNKLLPEADFRNNLLDEVRKFTRLNYCTIRDTKRLTNFRRKDLEGYFEFEASLLNL